MGLQSISIEIAKIEVGQKSSSRIQQIKQNQYFTDKLNSINTLQR
jgi:hypothetical protein